MQPTLKSNVQTCARCLGDHIDLVFAELRRPIEAAEAWTHWATCPVTGEPILLLVVADEPTPSRDGPITKQIQYAEQVITEVRKELIDECRKEMQKKIENSEVYTVKSTDLATGESVTKQMRVEMLDRQIVKVEDVDFDPKEKE